MPPGIGFDLTSEKPRCRAQKQETLGTSPGWHRACGWQQFLWVPPPNGKLLPLWSPLPLGGSLWFSNPSDTIRIASQYSILSKLGKELFDYLARCLPFCPEASLASREQTLRLGADNKLSRLISSGLVGQVSQIFWPPILTVGSCGNEKDLEQSCRQ